MQGRRPAQGGPAAVLIREHPSPNQDDRPEGATIDTLVLHYTGMRSGAAALARLCDPAAQVSSHYVVDEDGTVLRLVPEERRAWHAGISYWRGTSGLNATSIGIEIVNPGHEWGPRPYPEAQVEAVLALCRDLLARQRIDPWNVVGHSDVAPDRKQDPGEWFPWERLARAGIGLWPDGAVPSAPVTLPGSLASIGYPMDRGATPERAGSLAIAAFQRRFRPTRIDGQADAQTAGLALALAERIPPAPTPPGWSACG